MFGFDNKPWDNDFRAELQSKLPKIKPLTLKQGALLFGGVTVVGMMIGATIGTYIFFGVVTLAGLIAISESNPYVKYLVINGNKAIDLIIFAGTVYATAMLGVTVAAALTVAGLGYTLVYAPYVRQQAAKSGDINRFKNI